MFFMAALMALFFDMGACVYAGRACALAGVGVAGVFHGLPCHVLMRSLELLQELGDSWPRANWREGVGEVVQGRGPRGE